MLLREGKPGTQFMSVQEQFQRCRPRSLCPQPSLLKLGIPADWPGGPYKKENLQLETGFYRGEKPQGEAPATCRSLQSDNCQVAYEGLILVRNPRCLMYGSLEDSERQLCELL